MRHVSEPTELLLIGCSIESIWTPRSKSNTLTPKTTRRHTDKGKFHTWWLESSFVFVQHQPFQFHQQSWSDVEKNARRCRSRKSHSKIEADDEIWYPDTVWGILMCLLLLHLKARRENQIWKSNTSELVDWAAAKNGETCKGCLLIKLLRMEWWRKNVFSRVEVWWSAGSKNGETCEWTSSQFVHTAHTDRFIVDDDDMDSNTVTESDLSLKSRSFLHRVNDRVRKMLDESSKDATLDSNKHSLIWRNETEKSLSKFLEPHTPKVVCTDNGIRESMWRFIMESPHFNTLSIRDKWHCWKSRTKSKRRYFSRVLIQSWLDERWWADSVECYCYLRHVQDLLSDGKTPCERRFGKPFNGPIIPYGSLVEYITLFLRKTSQESINLEWKSYLDCFLFLGYALYAGRIWKGDIVVADIEELETMDASEIYSKKDSMQRK